MRKGAQVICLLILFASCKKEVTVKDDFSEASYKITITGLWRAPQFSVPAGAHFTYFSGAVHNEQAVLWKPGNLATPGIEAIAEQGNQFPLFTEVDNLIAGKKAIAQINIPPPVPDGSISRTVYCNNRFSHLSFASMIAPSPDWFVGITELKLYRSGSWLSDTTVQLFAYDAGTEDGDVFAYNNPATIPQQPIELLTPAKATVLANGNTSLAAIASVRITKQ
ncbi:MAG TPA: spondin domain-containing protein [Flavisolibacter sp.]|jgi:hypothetical protein|nr:spondin domain-containing protein [Flavisolibacter sp.]